MEERKVYCRVLCNNILGFQQRGGGCGWGIRQEGKELEDVEGIVLPMKYEAVTGAHILPPQLPFSAISRKLFLL